MTTRHRLVGLLSLLLAGSVPCPAARAAAPLAALLTEAGNARDEHVRLRRVREVAAHPDLPLEQRAEVAALLPTIEAWAEGRARVVADASRAAENGYLCWFISSRVRPRGEGAVHPPEPAAGSPLHPLWALYRGRMLIWRVIQSGPLLRVKESREAYYGEARALLEEARRAFPENPVIPIYLGQPAPWTPPCPPDPQAPEWANLQREGLEKLADLIHWWIRERQLPDGQFGGGWGDDVEMWRWWTPILIAFDDPLVAEAQERLAQGIFRQPHLHHGFTARLTDVEHSNEDTTDTILPMMHLRPDDPLWTQRALRLADLMRERWTGTNQHGFLQFRSIYFSVDTVDPSPRTAFDTVYHPSVVQPTLLHWQRSHDPGLTRLLGGWLRLWVEATARSGDGKPAGVLPSTVRWPDGGFGTPGRPWFEPFPASHNDALYNWPGATRLMTSTLLLAWHVTRDETYLAPLHSMAALRQRYPGRSGSAPPGTEAWCARQMSGFLPDALAKYRFLSGDRRYDALLEDDASGYVRFRLTGDERGLVSALRRNAEAFRSNWEAYTSEMRWTDRVLSFTRNYLQYLPEPAPPPPAPEVLYAAATGDPGNPLVFPLNAVRWLTPPRALAARVTEASRSAFRAELFHFGPQSRSLSGELYLLAPGAYAVTVRPAEARDPLPARVEPLRVDSPRTRFSLALPPRKLVTVEVQAVGP